MTTVVLMAALAKRRRGVDAAINRGGTRLNQGAYKQTKDMTGRGPLHRGRHPGAATFQSGPQRV